MTHTSETPLILASASPRRRELMGLLGVPFEVVPPEYEEVLPERDPDPAALAEHLALEKARDVSRRRPNALVIGTDTVVALGDRVYGKPADGPDAARMLGELSGLTHQVLTAVAVLGPGRGSGNAALQARGSDGEPLEMSTFVTTTDVLFRELDPAEIDAYVRTGEPMDKAGAYAIQGHGAVLIEGIRGDYPNVVGLPLAPLALLLRARGVRILGLPRDPTGLDLQGA